MNKLIALFLGIIFSLSLPLLSVKAMPVGTLLYRTSGDNKMYGYNEENLIVSEKGKLTHIYSGHAAIYIGQEKGIDYIVEMQPSGAIKVPAQYFINEAAGEKLVAAKLPINASPLQIATAVAIAKNLAINNMAYDFDFKKQKGPSTSEWTCVGLTEKIYESANISNPTNLKSLEYNQDYYAVDITKDGYDNVSIYNSSGDCFSDYFEYSKIAPKRNMLIPAPELLGYDVGLEINGDRYIFLPYTQSLSQNLKDVNVDINLSSSFTETDIRGKSPVLGLILKWSLINNPISSVKNIASKIESSLAAIKNKIFPDNSVALADYSVTSSDEVDIKKSFATTTSKISKASTSKATTSKIVATKTSLSKTPINTSSSSTHLKTPVSPVKTPVTSTSSQAVKVEKVSSSSNITTPVIPRTTIKPIATTSAVTVIQPIPVISTSTIVAVTTSTSAVVVVPAPVEIVVETPVVEEPVVEEPVIEESEEPIALIARIYSNDSDDWLEIVNTTDFNFDLAEAGYRIEKAKTGSDPTLVMRIGDENDGIYPSGTIINAHGTYLIANDEASPEILAKADAIAIKDTFTWSNEGYTIYLGRASISSDADIDIVDKLGYGEAKYFETAPAPALARGYALERKANVNSTLELLMKGGLEEFWPRLFDSNDNSTDFILIPYDESLILSEDGHELETEQLTTNPDLYVTPSGLDSENLTQLWHFDECQGDGAYNELQSINQAPVDFVRAENWTAGKWGCGAGLSSLYASTKAVFPENLDLNQGTMNFYYRNHDQGVRFQMIFYNSEENGQSASIEFTPDHTAVTGFPGPNGRLNDVKWPNDNAWHQVSLVVDRINGFLALYLDANEIYRYEYNGIFPLFKYLEITGTNNYETDFDELSFWNRALPLSELKTINILNQPFNPYSWPIPQKEAQLIHYWNFDENSGGIAYDTASQDDLLVSNGQWNIEGKFNSALTVGNTIEANLAGAAVSDLTLSFWWRNISYSNEGRLLLSLNSDNNAIMSIKPTPYNSSYSFNGYGESFVSYPVSYIPDDNNWHHLVMTYDSYRYLLKFYVDGQEEYRREFVRLRADTKIDGLKIIQENWPSAIDELKIWDGVLFSSQVKAEFEATK